MKNVLHKKGWGIDTNPAHIEPPTIPLIKEMCTGKSYENHGKLKLRRDSTYSTLEFYEFSMSLFDHGEPVLFGRNFKITLLVTETLETE